MLTTAQGYTNRLCRSFRGASRLMMRERRLRSAIPHSRSEVFTLQYIQIYYRGATHIFGDFVSTDTSQAGARRSPTRKARWHWWKQYKFLLRQAIIYGNWFVRRRTVISSSLENLLRTSSVTFRYASRVPRSQYASPDRYSLTLP
jgi:hypothetical protein